MVFRIQLISKDLSIPPITIQQDTSTVIGRDARFGINDRRVSRKHIELVPSSSSKTVLLHQLSPNPSVLQRQNEQPQNLSKDDVYQLQGGDVVSLLSGKYTFTVHIEDDSDSKEMEEGFSEDATQVDLEAIEEMERRKAKRKASEQEDMQDCAKKPRLERPLLGSGSGILINPKELMAQRTIGIGSCGEVSECSWRGTRVAVKKIFRTLLHGDALKEFYLESDMMRRLRHPNIVLFMGTCVQGKELCIVTEFMERGSLRDVLKDQTLDLDWNLRLRMTADAAKGMNYLHSYNPPIIHRDLKSHNLLVDRNFNVKVTDFGLAKFQVEDKSKTFCGTLPWTAPEVFSGMGYSATADVYSYGIVLWEVATRQEPYTTLQKPEIIIGVTKEHLRPSIPGDCPPGYAELTKDCWVDDPTQRPTFAEILVRLEAFQNPNGTKPVGKGDVTPSPMSLTQQFKGFASEVFNHKWEIEPKDLIFMEELGEGSCATVYRGSFQGQLVAIKVLKESLDGKHKDDFNKEIEVISSVKTPYVVQFFGACTKPQYAIVTELLPNGSLYQVMNRQDVNFEWEMAIKLASESALALNSLHSCNPAVIHRDFKPQNLLVASDFTVKITDFGLARFSNAHNESLAKLKGSYAYAAPEAYQGQAVTTKSDVFSFGIVLWEIVSRCVTKAYQKPYGDHKNLRFDFQIIIQTAKQGLRPTIHTGTPGPFVQLMQKCWDMDPEKRPTMQEVISSMNNIKSLFEREKQAANAPQHL